MLNDEGTPSPVSVSVRPLEDWFGIIVAPQTQSHWQANADISGIADRDSSIQPRFDYKNDIKVTGYFRSDEYALGVWPPVANITNNASTLVIRLGDIAFHDTLLQGTIVDLEAGTAKLAPADIVVRDDTELLTDIARLAANWYGILRYAYQVSYAQITHDVHPGQIASNVDGAVTDVVVTDVVWDFRHSRTDITTGYAEPNFQQIAREAVV